MSRFHIQNSSKLDLNGLVEIMLALVFVHRIFVNGKLAKGDESNTINGQPLYICRRTEVCTAESFVFFFSFLAVLCLLFVSPCGLYCSSICSIAFKVDFTFGGKRIDQPLIFAVVFVIIVYCRRLSIFMHAYTYKCVA